MVTVPHKMVGLERCQNIQLLEYRGFSILYTYVYVCAYVHNYTVEELSRGQRECCVWMNKISRICVSLHKHT